MLAGGGRGLLALALLGPVAAACGSTPSGPDPLEEQVQAARRDSELAAAAAKAAPPALVPALNEIAAERKRHAVALIEEVSRAAGKPTPTETASGEASGAAAGGTASASAAPGPPPPPPSVADVSAALRRSADSAAALVPTLSGYRAGLLGSIAAACTAAHTVGLPPTRRPQ
ncbi:MAG: hypothetical protein FGM50_10095 [Mycobacterium sp.]|nr:hypothetical protein [Mycobacterium sp.]